jgi:hypothetical protein
MVLLYLLRRKVAFNSPAENAFALEEDQLGSSDGSHWVIQKYFP